MAVTKSTRTVKKTAKKGKVQARPLTWRFYVVAIGIFTIAVATMIVIALFTAHFTSTKSTQTRLDRINSIYASLNLDDSYIVQKSNVFGDKRSYEWDKSRSYASEVDYIHASTVSNTVADLDAKIKAAGFGFIDEPYPGGASTQYHYKSSKGEYIRLTVSSKPRDDAFQNAYLMNKTVPANLANLDVNAGPSNVVIKVNLDDNNE